jgi:hypothetical protein
LWSEAERWYSQDVWNYYLGRLGLECTASREIISLGGYLPRKAWKEIASIEVPAHDDRYSFVVDEVFDSTSRSCSEDASYEAAWSPEQRCVHVTVTEPDLTGDVLVSPHEDLVLGAAGRAGLVLVDIYFLNVRGTDREQPTYNGGLPLRLT